MVELTRDDYLTFPIANSSMYCMEQSPVMSLSEIMQPSLTSKELATDARSLQILTSSVIALTLVRQGVGEIEVKLKPASNSRVWAAAEAECNFANT